MIKLKFQDKINRVQLVLPQNEISTTFGFSRNETIEILSMDKNSNRVVPGIPVKIITFEEKDVVSGITDVNGKLELPLPKFDFFEGQKQIILSMDFQGMQLSPNAYPQTPIDIKINSPLIAVKIEEKLLNKKSENPIIGPMIKVFFSSNLSANFGEVEDADLIIYGVVNTTKKSVSPNEWGIYQTFADATITAINGRTGDEIYSVTIPQIQGADFNSNEGSAIEGIRKISKRMENFSLPQILKRVQKIMLLLLDFALKQ